MKPTKPNLEPKIDWEAQTTELYTDHGMHHQSSDTLSPHSISCAQTYESRFIAVDFFEDFISFIPYMTKSWSTFCRVNRFKQDTKGGAKVFTREVYFQTCKTLTGITYTISKIQLRIYQNGKIAPVFLVIAKDHPEIPERYFVFKILLDSFKRISFTPGQRPLEDPGDNLVEVFSEEDIKKAAFTPSMNIWNELRMAFPRCSEYFNASHRFINSANANTVKHWSTDIRDQIEKFLDVAKHPGAIARVSKKEGQWGGHVLVNLRPLIMYTTMTDDKIAKTNNKLANARKRLEELTAPVAKLWHEVLTTKPATETAYWYRNGDNVCLIRTQDQYDLATKFFSYNVKTKKRFYVECCADGTMMNVPVPSLKYLNGALRLDITTRGSKLLQGAETKLIDTTFEDLFKGTSLEWLQDECLDSLVVGGVWENGVPKSGRIAEFRNVFNKDHLGSAVVSILSISGQRVYEQLLKAKLYNLFFYMIYDAIDGYGYCVDISTKDLPPRYGYSVKLIYNSKEKNLPTIFGHNLKILRYIDRHIAQGLKAEASRQEKESHFYIHPCFSFPTHSFAVLPLDKRVFPDLDTADEATLKNIFEGEFAARARSTTGFWYRIARLRENREFSPLSLSKVLDLVSKCCLPAKKNRDHIETYLDYIRISDLLKKKIDKLIETGKEVETSLSEQNFPTRPKKTTKFIPYLPGMLDPRYRSICLNNESAFQRYIENMFEESCKNGEVEFVHDKFDKRILGALVHMSPVEHMCYLHDLASYWDRYYEDTAKDELFADAVKRVKPLEWQDPSSGLEIIAPTGAASLREEGRTLCHCVASYIDPIINGTENIMFIRRIDMPGIPFFTLEILDSGEVRQIHCYRNGDLSELGQSAAYTNSGLECYNKTFDIVGFLLKWAKHFPERVKASSIKSRYDALCARR